MRRQDSALNFPPILGTRANFNPFKSYIFNSHSLLLSGSCLNSFYAKPITNNPYGLFFIHGPTQLQFKLMPICDSAHTHQSNISIIGWS